MTISARPLSFMLPFTPRLEARLCRLSCTPVGRDSPLAAWTVTETVVRLTGAEISRVAEPVVRSTASAWLGKILPGLRDLISSGREAGEFLHAFAGLHRLKHNRFVHAEDRPHELSLSLVGLFAGCNAERKCDGVLGLKLHVGGDVVAAAEIDR